MNSGLVVSFFRGLYPQLTIERADQDRLWGMHDSHLKAGLRVR